MKNTDWEKINDILKKYTKIDAFYKDMLDVIDNLAQQYIEVGIDFFDQYDLTKNLTYNYKNEVSGLESYKLAYDFLKFIDKKYSVKLDEIFNEGILNLPDYDDIYTENLVTQTVRENDQDSINIPLKYNISDVYKIVHEVFHFFNLPNTGTNTSEARNYFTEFISILSEFLLEDYLNKKRYSNQEYYFLKLDRFLDTYYAVAKLLCIFSLLKCYIENGKLNNEIYYNYSSNLSESKQKIINKYSEYVIESILIKESLDISYPVKYFIGILFASSFYNKLNGEEMQIEDLIDLNDNINYFNISDILNGFNYRFISNNNKLDFNKNNYDELINSYQDVFNNTQNKIKTLINNRKR